MLGLRSTSNNPSLTFIEELQRINSTYPNAYSRRVGLDNLLASSAKREFYNGADPTILAETVRGLHPDVLYLLCSLPNKKKNSTTNSTTARSSTIQSMIQPIELPDIDQHALTMQALCDHFDYQNAQLNFMQVLACMTGLVKAAKYDEFLNFLDRLPNNLSFISAAENAEAEQSRKWTSELINSSLWNVKFTGNKTDPEKPHLLKKLILEKKFKLDLDGVQIAITSINNRLSYSLPLNSHLVLLAGGASFNKMIELTLDEDCFTTFRSINKKGMAERKERMINNMWKSLDKSFVVPNEASGITHKEEQIALTARCRLEPNLCLDTFDPNNVSSLEKIVLSILLLEKLHVFSSLTCIRGALVNGAITRKNIVAVNELISKRTVFSKGNPFNLLLLLHHGISDGNEELSMPSLQDILKRWPKNKLALLNEILIGFTKNNWIHPSVLEQNPWLTLYAQVSPYHADIKNARVFTGCNELLFSRLDCLAALKQALSANNSPEKLSEILSLYALLNPGSKLVAYKDFLPPLHYAVRENKASHLRALLESDLFDINAFDSDGKTALALAKNVDGKACQAVLEEFGAIQHTADYYGKCSSETPDQIPVMRISENDFQSLIQTVINLDHPGKIEPLGLEFIIHLLAIAENGYRPTLQYLCDLQNLLLSTDDEGLEAYDKTFNSTPIELRFVFIKMLMAERLPKRLEAFFNRKLSCLPDVRVTDLTKFDKALLLVESSQLKGGYQKHVLLDYLLELIRQNGRENDEKTIAIVARFYRSLRAHHSDWHERVSKLLSGFPRGDIAYHCLMIDGDIKTSDSAWKEEIMERMFPRRDVVYHRGSGDIKTIDATWIEEIIERMMGDDPPAIRGHHVLDELFYIATLFNMLQLFCGVKLNQQKIEAQRDYIEWHKFAPETEGFSKLRFVKELPEDLDGDQCFSELEDANKSKESALFTQWQWLLLDIISRSTGAMLSIIVPMITKKLAALPLCHLAMTYRDVDTTKNDNLNVLFIIYKKLKPAQFLEILKKFHPLTVFLAINLQYPVDADFFKAVVAELGLFALVCFYLGLKGTSAEDDFHFFQSIYTALLTNNVNAVTETDGQALATKALKLKKVSATDKKYLGVYCQVLNECLEKIKNENKEPSTLLTTLREILNARSENNYLAHQELRERLNKITHGYAFQCFLNSNDFLKQLYLISICSNDGFKIAIPSVSMFSRSNINEFADALNRSQTIEAKSIEEKRKEFAESKGKDIAESKEKETSSSSNDIANNVAKDIQFPNVTVFKMSLVDFLDYNLKANLDVLSKIKPADINILKELFSWVRKTISVQNNIFYKVFLALHQRYLQYLDRGFDELLKCEGVPQFFDLVKALQNGKKGKMNELKATVESLLANDTELQKLLQLDETTSLLELTRQWDEFSSYLKTEVSFDAAFMQYVNCFRNAAIIKTSAERVMNAVNFFSSQKGGFGQNGQPKGKEVVNSVEEGSSDSDSNSETDTQVSDDYTVTLEDNSNENASDNNLEDSSSEDGDLFPRDYSEIKNSNSYATELDEFITPRSVF